MLLIDIELAYMNTNHEDFIGFAKWVFLAQGRWPRECVRAHLYMRVLYAEPRPARLTLWVLCPW
jgi:hypothetical protein